MLRQLHTVAFRGITAIPIVVQVHMLGGSLPCFSIVGLADKAVNESRERIKAALSTMGLALPPKRIIINLSPANIQKEGSHYDLPLAVGLLMALEILPQELEQAIVLGELGLDASIKPVGGVLSAALLAAEHRRLLVCPGECGGEAMWGGSPDVLAPTHLLQLVNHFKGTQVLSPPEGKVEEFRVHRGAGAAGDMGDIRGQETAKRVMMIAAAGGHNVLLSGPPGTGKSMLANRLISLLPPLSPQESLEVSMIHSLSNGHRGHLLRCRPFRSPHHSASMVALVGGGSKSMPGEISLAHGGVLFLDELPEFSRAALESLRPALESGEAVVARANYHVIYPARFQLVAAMNPCPCGYLGHPERQCAKAPECGKRYQQRLSGPFLDRIDLFCQMPSLEPQDFLAPSEPHSAQALWEKVEAARTMQENRYGINSYVRNADAPPAWVQKEIQKEPSAVTLLQQAVTKLSLSARSYYRLVKVARTIADLEASPTILRCHMAEALAYRLFPV